LFSESPLSVNFSRSMQKNPQNLIQNHTRVLHTTKDPESNINRPASVECFNVIEYCFGGVT